MKKFFLLFLFSFCALAEISVKIETDRSSYGLDDEIILKVRLFGTKNVDDGPLIKNIDDFEIQSSGTSSRFNYVNGKTSIEQTYNFILYPRQMGQYELGPVSFMVDGKKYFSNQININIEKSVKPDIDTSKFYFIDSTVSNLTPYVGEQIVYTLKFFHRISLTDAAIPPPEWLTGTTQGK